jgi:hypothetical protein
MMQDQIDLIDAMRDDGYMVIIFTPDELRNLTTVDATYMENLVTLKGREFIDFAAAVQEANDESR